MIPALIDIGSPWPVLPPGVHDATLDELKESFAETPHRERLFEGLKRGIEALRRAGCRAIYVDGSFVTGKPLPQDYDACWDTTGVDVGRLDEVLLDFKEKRRRQKKKFQGEFFPSSSPADERYTFLDFFQIDRYTNKPKGIVRIGLVRGGGADDHE